MNKEEKRKSVFAQLNSLPNAFQYVEVTNYIKSLEQENKELKEGNTIYNQFVNYKNWYFDYVDKYEKLQQENKELHNKIDKAIGYNQEIINQYEESDMCEYCDGRVANAEHNLKLLKDSDVDE